MSRLECLHISDRRVRVFVAVAAVTTATFLHPVSAHEDKTPMHFVAEHGVDQGDCSMPERPCATIDYALQEAGKGDEIRVGTGVYSFRSDDPAEIVTLLSELVTVRGESVAEDKFALRDEAANRTVLVTSNNRHAASLRTNGFVVLSEAQLQAETSPLAHTGMPRHVSESGRDTGDCSTVERPCASISYALTQARQGDVVLVASGTYIVPETVVEDLRQAGVTMVGGLSQIQGFVHDMASPPSYVYGPSHRQRKALTRLGLTLIQDRKGLAIAESIATPRLAVATSLAATPCDPASGMAGPYPCRNVDFLANIPLSGFSSNPRAANDIWGFVDLNDNHEYAIIGLLNGTAVVDVTDPENPIEVATVSGPIAKWRDIKVVQLRDTAANRWRAFAYVTADIKPPSQQSQGLQIINLSDLPNSVSVGGNWIGIHQAHNVYISNVDYTTGVPLPGMKSFVYVTGANVDFGDGGLIGLDISSPTAPTEVLNTSHTAQYIHDGTSIVIDDARTAACKSGNAQMQGHNPCEVFIDYNEDTLDIWDVTDKSAPLMLSSTYYKDAHYTHSGWWSEDKRSVFLQDELDEMKTGRNTTIRVFDISDLTAPWVVGVWSGDKHCIDHNSFVVGKRLYMSTYRCGLTVLDITNAANPIEVGFFDTYPDPPENKADFRGSWGVYPFLPSGSLLVSNIEDGLFVLRESKQPKQ